MTAPETAKKPPSIAERHRRAVEDLAVEYEKQGYAVQIEPRLSDTPENLRPYAPDLIATKGNETIIAEVKTWGHKRPEGYWSALAEKAAQAGWIFRIVVAEGEEDDTRSYTLPDAATIQARLAGPAKVAADGERGAALLLSWSLFEAAARRRLLRDSFDPGRPVTPVGLAKTLVHYGYLDEEELTELRKVASLRNQVAHGLVTADVPSDWIDLLTSLTRRLLADEQAA